MIYQALTEVLTPKMWFLFTRLVSTKIWQTIDNSFLWLGLVLALTNEGRTVTSDLAQMCKVIFLWLLKMLLIPAKLLATDQDWWRNLCHLGLSLLTAGKFLRDTPFLCVSFVPSSVFSMLSCLGLSALKNFPTSGHLHMLFFSIEWRPFLFPFPLLSLQ